MNYIKCNLTSSNWTAILAIDESARISKNASDYKLGMVNTFINKNESNYVITKETEQIIDFGGGNLFVVNQKSKAPQLLQGYINIQLTPANFTLLQVTLQALAGYEFYANSTAFNTAYPNTVPLAITETTYTPVAE